VSAKKLVLLITIVISLLAFIFFLPVGFDSWVYGKNFKELIAKEYSYRMGEIFVYSHPEYQKLVSYNFNNYTPNLTELTRNMEWHGRLITTKASITFNDEQYIVIFQGTRFWIKKYWWEVKEIVRK
jgi:hypothetical protein